MEMTLVPGIDGHRLGCDCYAGCWGDHSRGWPGMSFATKEDLDLAWRLCHQELTVGVSRPKEEQVGHGNYVLGKDGVLRFATAALRDVHVRRLQELLPSRIEMKSLQLSESLLAREELQRRVKPFGWDVEELAPDLAVPHLELLRRDGRVKVRMQRAGKGWSIEVGHRQEVIRRGYGNGPELSAVEWDEQILRFNGTSQISDLSEALRLVAQIVSENGPRLLPTSDAPLQLEEG